VRDCLHGHVLSRGDSRRKISLTNRADGWACTGDCSIVEGAQVERGGTGESWITNPSFHHRPPHAPTVIFASVVLHCTVPLILPRPAGDSYCTALYIHALQSVTVIAINQLHLRNFLLLFCPSRGDDSRVFNSSLDVARIQRTASFSPVLSFLIPALPCCLKTGPLLARKRRESDRD
jgi:hypothetical protein